MFTRLLYAIAVVCLILALLSLVGVLHLAASAGVLFVAAIVCAVLAYFLSGARVP